MKQNQSRKGQNLRIFENNKELFKYTEAELQSAASDMDKPASATAKVEALQTECALKIEVSIPALDNPVFIHLAIVAAEAG